MSPAKPLTLHLTASQQLTGVSAAGVVVLLLAVRFLYVPLWGAIGQSRARLVDLRVKTADARELAQRLPSQEAAVAEAQRRYDQASQRFGSADALGKVLELLRQYAQGRRVELAVVQERGDEAGERLVPLGTQVSLREVPMRFQITGRYRQIGEFLGDLQRAPFVSLVKQLSLSKADAGKLHAEMVLAIYLAKSPASGSER